MQAVAAGSCGRRSRNSTAFLRAVGEDDRTGQAHNGDAMLLMAPKSLILTKRSAREGGFCEGVKESAVAAGRAHNSTTYDMPWTVIGVAKLTTGMPCS